MSKSEVLKAEPRPHLGSRHARKLRAAGRIPASLQSDGKNPHVDLSIDAHNFLATRRHHTHLYEIELGGRVETAVVRELQWDVFGESIVHIDFKRVRRDQQTDSEVELEFVGHPKGGLLNHLITHVTIRCLPDAIPDSIEVPVGKLETGQSVLARELVLPPGVELVEPAHPDTRIAVVVTAKVVEPTPGEAVPAEGAVAAPAAAPEGGTPAKD